MNPVTQKLLPLLHLRGVLVLAASAMILSGGLAGCATVSNNMSTVGNTVSTNVAAAGSKVGGAVKDNLNAAADALTDTVSPDDPIEPINRAIYKFNDTFDRVLLQPVAKGYSNVVPQPIRNCVGNIFDNVSDVGIALNNALQGKLRNATSDAGRFAVNSTAGILGCFDVASEAGLEKHKADFGLTLGVWGVPTGPYVMLPFLGPSTVRDAFGRFTLDAKTNAIFYIDHIPTRNETYALSAVDARASVLNARSFIQDASLDAYVFIREAYLGRRRNQVGEAESGKVEQAAEAPPSSANIEPTQVSDSGNK